MSILLAALNGASGKQRARWVGIGEHWRRHGSISGSVGLARSRGRHATTCHSAILRGREIGLEDTAIRTAVTAVVSCADPVGVDSRPQQCTLGVAADLVPGICIKVGTPSRASC